jgi:hypothetical protein
LFIKLELHIAERAGGNVSQYFLGVSGSQGAVEEGRDEFVSRAGRMGWKIAPEEAVQAAEIGQGAPAGRTLREVLRDLESRDGGGIRECGKDLLSRTAAAGWTLGVHGPP